jgi:hypothetical protein
MALGTATALALAAGAGMGAAKGAKNRAANKRDREIRATTIENSPWTGMSDPGETQRPGMLESTLQGGLTGAMMAQSLGLGGGAGALPVESPGMAPAMNTSALGSEVLNKQLTNPAIQNPWASMNPYMRS